jgi:hypothetical protein
MIEDEWERANVDVKRVDWGYLSAGDNVITTVDPRINSDRADCCSAHPAFSVVLPPSEQRTYHTTLLMCGHHLRSTRTSLRAARACVYDASGRLIASGS